MRCASSAYGATPLCCLQVDKAVRAASQAKVLQLLRQGSRNAAAVTIEGLRLNNGKHAGQVMHTAKPPTAADWAPGGIWGLGTAKSLQAFESLCGVKFKEKLLEQQAIYGGQDPAMFVEM